MIGQDQDPFAGWASSAKSYEGMTPTEVRLYRNRRLLESAYTEDDKERLERDIKRDTPRGFWESLFTDEYGQETTLPFAVPFIGSASSGIDLYNAHLASEKGRATKEQSRILKDYYDYAVRPTTTWGQAASIGREVMAFGVEFAASGGAGAIGAKAIAAGGKTASKSMLRKVLVSGFREKSINAGKTGLAKMGLALKEAALRTPGQLTRMELQKEGVRIAGALVGIEAEGGPIRARAYMNYLHHRYQIVPENEYGASVRVIDDSYGMWSAAIPNAVVDNLVEVFSEHTGYAIAHMVPSLKMGLLGKPFKEGGVSEKVMAALGLAGDVPSAQLLQRVGVSGLIPEMGEEFVGALVRDIVHEIAPVLADEGNTQHLIDNIVPITLGMGLGIFGTSAATGAISYTDGLGMYGKFSPIAKKLFSEMNSAVPFGERVGVLRGLERIARLNAEGLSANGSAELVAGANVRAKFFISDAVTEQAKSNLHRKSIEKGEEKPDLSREAIKEEKELLWAEFIEKPLAGNVQKVVEATGEILEEAGSPAMEHLIRLGVIEEGEVAELLGNAEKRLLELQAAAKDGTLTEYWEALGAELIEVELAKTVEAGVAVSADPTSLRVAAFTAAKKELARLMAIAETGKSGGELLEREIQRLEFEPHLEGESKDIASRVSRADKNWAREHVEEVKEALERASATYRKGQEKAGKDVSEEGQLFGVAEEQDSDNETVTAAINFGVILIAIDGRGTGVAGLWDSKEKILFYDPQEIEAQALAHNIGAAEMYRITIYRELLRAHITDIGKENASAWLQAAKKWLDEVNANWRVKLKINTAQYEGLSDEKILEHEVTLALSMFAEVGKVQELREEEEATGFVAAIKRFASWLMEIALPKTFGSSKILVSLRDALNVAGFDVSEMTPAQVMMAGATAEHVRQIIGMLSPSMEIASVIANDFIGPLQEHQKRLAEITKEEAPGEAAPPRQEAAPGPEEPQINRKYLESLPSRKAVIDLAKDLKVEGLNVTNVSGSKDQVINSILKALEAEIVHDFYADPIDDVGFMALEGTGPLQQRMTKKIGNQINERAKRHLPKERVKTRQATQFIGRGKAGSSTSKYMQMYNEEGVANTGDYTANDIVYVSSNGKRVGRVNPVIRGELQGVYTNIDKAIKAGASIIMDTAEHLQKTGGYNIGELALADYLATHGYARQGVSGMWKPADKGAAPKGPTPVTTSAQSASQPVFTRGETIGGSPHEEMTEAATSSELEALRAEAGIIQADGSIPEKTPREKQAALWKSDKYTKAPHYMLTPYNAAKVGKIVLVHDYLSADSATYRGRIINIDKTGMVEIRVRRLRVDNGAIKVSEEAPYTMSTSRHNLYSPNFSWHLVSTEEGLAWRSMGKIKGKVQTVQVKVSGEFEESGLSAIPKVSRPPISFQALQLYKRKEGGAITTEDVERTGRRVYEHMRTLVNLESLAFIGKKREAVKEEKEEEKEKSTGITYKADSSANRYQFNQALADLIDADPTIVERIIKFDSKGFHIKKKTIRAALMATKNVEGLIVSAKDIMIAEAAIGGGWEYLIKPIKEDLSRLKSGVITENGLRVLIKQASKKSPGSPREVALKFLLSSLLRAEGLKSASVGGVFDVKSVPPGQAERKVVPDEEDKRIKVEETSTTETDPSQSAAPLGKGINIRQLESILGYMFTASVQAATPMGAAESAEYEKALKDAGIGFRYDESGAIDSTDAWWNAWVSTVPGDNLTPEEYAAIADIQAHSAPMESTEGDTTEELTLDYQTPSRRSLGATLTVLTSDVATGVKDQRMPTIATARDEDIKAMIAELLPKNNEETFPNLARIILSGHVSEAREELIRVLGGATGGRWKKSDVPVKDVFGIEQDPRAVFEPLSINLKGLSLKGKKILKAFDRVAAEQSRYEMGWREKIRGESAEGVAKTVRNIAGTRVSGTAGWIHLLNKEEDLSMLRGTLKHVSTLAGLEGASALVEYRVSSLDNLVSKARDSDVVSKRIMDLAPAALTEGIRNKYTILSSEINTAIQLLEDGDYAGLAIHLEVEHKSNPEVYLMAPKRQSLEMPMIKRFADAHSTLIKRAVMAGKWVVQTGVPGGKVQLVLNPSIMLTKDIGGPNLIKRLEALRELRPDWKGSGRERRAALLPNATSADIEKFIQDGLSLTRTKGGLVGGRKLPLGPIKVSSRNVDLPSKDKPGRRPKRKWGTAPTTHPTEQTWPTKEAPMRQPAEGELPTWGTTLTLSRGGVEINVLFRGTGTSSGDTITVFPYNPKGEGTAWFKEMGYGQRALLHTFARSIPAYWHLDGNRLAEADRAVVSKAFEMEDAYINEETDFLALDPTTAGIRKNFASMGGSLLSMWDASKLPLINGSAEMSTVFLMSYDRWREDSAEWVYRLDADLKKNREDIIDYVENVEGLKGLSNIRAKNARIDQIRAALFVRMDLDYWAVSKGGRATQPLWMSRVYGITLPERAN